MTYLNKAYFNRRYRTASTMTQHTKQHKLKSFDSYLKVFEALEDEYNKADYTQQQKQFIKRQLLSIYNGLLMSDVHPQKKKQLKQFTSITLKDRAFILSSTAEAAVVQINQNKI
ncbi:MAG: hypothetical protein U5K84_06600 [Alkalibacterium sp.]|nr:hypothetical protein [Alkalibacterium sp.]